MDQTLRILMLPRGLAGCAVRAWLVKYLVGQMSYSIVRTPPTDDIILRPPIGQFLKTVFTPLGRIDQVQTPTGQFIICSQPPRT